MADESTEGMVTVTESPGDADADKRLENLVELLENDPLGYRTERFVAGQREALATRLTSDAFHLMPSGQVTVESVVQRVQAYDAAIMPWVPFFAVGAAYGAVKDAPLWTGFTQRVATCNIAANAYNETLLKLSLYPTFHLLYAAGTLAASRRQWATVAALLKHPLALKFGEEKALVLATSSFDVLNDGLQKALPGRAREYTPLLNHLYEVLKPVLLTYFLSEEDYSAAFSYFEVMLAGEYAHAQKQYDIKRYGKTSDRFWVPPGRFTWLHYGLGTRVDSIESEAVLSQGAWPPAVGGLFSGNVQGFLDIVPNLKDYASRRSW